MSVLRRVLTDARRVSRMPGGAPLGLALLSGCAAQSWFRLGTLVAAGDNTPEGLLRPGQALSATRWAWGFSTTATGAPDYFPVLRTLPAALGQALAPLGLGPGVSQRVLLTVLFASLAPAMFLFLRLFLPGRQHLIGVALGALFYAFNPALFFVIPNPVLLTSLVLLPLIPALLVRGVRSQGWLYPVLLALLAPALAYAFENPPMFALVIAVSALTALAVSARERLRALPFALRALPLAVFANAWWVTPAALTLARPSVRVSADADPFAWGWTQTRSSLAHIVRLTPNWSWPKPEYFPYAPTLEHPMFVALAFLPAAATLAAVAVVHGRRRRIAVGTLAAAGAVVFLAKGLHAPLVGVNASLYRLVPGMWLFREPAAKFTPLLAGLFAVGIALLVSTAPRGWRRRLLAAGLGVSIAAVSFPIWLGRVVPSTRPGLPSAHVRIPRYWTEAAAYLNARPGPALLLPADDYYQMPYRWGFYGADVLADDLLTSPVVKLIDPVGTSYLNPDPHAYRLLSALRERIASGRIENAVTIARLLGVRWILVRRDIDASFPQRTIDDPDRLTRLLMRSRAVRHAARFGLLDLFSPRGLVRDRVWASGDVLVASSRSVAPVDLPLAVSSPIVAREPPPTLAVRPLIGIDATAWRAGDDGLTASTGAGGGTYRAFLSWPYGVPAEAKVAGDELRIALRPLTLAGRELPAPFAEFHLRLSDPAVPHLLTLHGETTALSTAAPTPLTLDPGTNSLVISSLEDAKVLTGPLAGGAWGPVGDCDARDAQTPRELGLRAAQVGGGSDGGFALALSALDHSACVSRALAGFEPQGLYRLSLDSLRREGSAPRLCVWQEGPNRCLALPPLAAGPGWQHYDRTFRPESGTTGLRLYLYADGNHSNRTTSLYSSVAVTRYRPTTTVHLGVSAHWSQAGGVALQRPSVLLRGVGGSEPVARLPGGSFERGTWGRAGDCDARDARTPRELGLLAAQVRGGSDGGFALALSALDHSACVSVALAGFAPAGVYRLSLDSLRREGSPPRFCVWQEGVNRCLPLAPLAGETGWQHYDRVFRPESGATGLRLFLYADGDRGRRTTSLYDAVRLDAFPARPAIALVGRARRRLPAAPALVVRARNPTSYRVDVRDASGPFVLVLAQTFDRGWSLTGARARHVRVDGYANGWIVDGRGPLRLELSYRPQRLVDAARLSVFGVPILLALAAIASFMRRRSVLRRAQAGTEEDTLELVPAGLHELAGSARGD